jgi:hypothetical protein
MADKIKKILDAEQDGVLKAAQENLERSGEALRDAHQDVASAGHAEYSIRNQQNQPHPFAGGKPGKPTKAHRKAIWESMLGAVYAQNDEGEIKYFDYDWAGARAFAGVEEQGRDPRIFKNKTAYNGTNCPSIGQPVLYVVRV